MRWLEPQPPVHARIEMFVETADRNAGLLHYIGNADAFQTEFAKPLGSNSHDPSVRLRLVTLRITHLASSSFPDPHGSPQQKVSSRVSAYSSLIGCKRYHPGARSSLHKNYAGLEIEARNASKEFYKILCNFWITVILYCGERADQPFRSKEKQ